MNFTAINFPWTGRNPYQQAGMVWLFVLLLTLPLVVMAAVVKQAWWAGLIPVAFATLMGLMFLMVSLFVRNAMQRVERAISPAADGGADEFRANGFVVKNLFRTPGVIVVRSDRLVLVPMLGTRVELELAHIRNATEKRLFNGNLLMGGAGGFWLDVDRTAGRFWRLGLAVPNPREFRAALERHRVPVG